MRKLIVTMALVIGACGGTTTTTTEALVATTVGEPTSSTSAAPDPLVPEGCSLIDGARLGEMLPLGEPLDLLDEDAKYELLCVFTAVGEGIDQSVIIQVEAVADNPEDHFTTPSGDLQSPIEIGGKAGVGTGRGSLRLLLTEDKGLTVSVLINSISSDGTIPSNGVYLSIRDEVAEYLVDVLG